MGDWLQNALDDFDTACREARDLMAATDRFRNNEANRTLAYLSLAEARAMAYNFAVAPRLDHPRINGQQSWHSHFYSLGGNCHDFRYGVTLLDGRESYRLTGRVGDLKLALFQVQNTIMGHSDHREVSNIDLLDVAGQDGTFDVVISSERQEGPWIELDPDSRLNFVIVRRILASIADDPGQLRIERIGGEEPASHTDPHAMSERLHRAADLMRYIVTNWCIGLYDMYKNAAGGVNRIVHIAGKELADNVLGSPSTTYGLGAFELEPEEALLIEWRVPDTAYWSFQLQDVWSNPLDFFNYQTGIGMIDATIDENGIFRAVVSAQDPGITNWLDTRGLRDGVVIMRNYRARGETQDPVMEKVRFAELSDRLPSDTPRIGLDERLTALNSRRVNYLNAYGD